MKDYNSKLHPMSYPEKPSCKEGVTYWDEWHMDRYWQDPPQKTELQYLYETAVEHISNLERDNIYLRNQVSKLKFSLASIESDTVEDQVKFQWELPKSKTQESKQRDTKQDDAALSYQFPGLDEKATLQVVKEDLLHSQSFLSVSTGTSILDSLSEETRKDVVLRYCSLLSALNKK